MAGAVHVQVSVALMAHGRARAGHDARRAVAGGVEVKVRHAVGHWPTVGERVDALGVVHVGGRTAGLERVGRAVAGDAFGRRKRVLLLAV